EHATLPDVTECASPVFAPGTFDDSPPPDQGYICNEVDPRRGAAALRADVVRANKGRATSDAMREWSLLGWYEMAVFSVIRARCCPDAAPLALPALPDSCVQLDGALNDLGAAAAGKTREDGNTVERAMVRYADAIRCAVRSSASMTYPYGGHPKG